RFRRSHVDSRGLRVIARGIGVDIDIFVLLVSFPSSFLGSGLVPSGMGRLCTITSSRLFGSAEGIERTAGGSRRPGFPSLFGTRPPSIVIVLARRASGSLFIGRMVESIIKIISRHALFVNPTIAIFTDIATSTGRGIWVLVLHLATQLGQ